MGILNAFPLMIMHCLGNIMTLVFLLQPGSGFMVSPSNLSASFFCPNAKACPGGNAKRTCEVPPVVGNLDVPGRKLGSMVRITGLFHLPINGIYWGYNPLILTIDPNFLGHPSIAWTPWNSEPPWNWTYCWWFKKSQGQPPFGCKNSCK